MLSKNIITLRSFSFSYIFFFFYLALYICLFVFHFVLEYISLSSRMSFLYESVVHTFISKTKHWVFMTDAEKNMCTLYQNIPDVWNSKIKLSASIIIHYTSPCPFAHTSALFSRSTKCRTLISTSIKLPLR